MFQVAEQGDLNTLASLSAVEKAHRNLVAYMMSNRLNAQLKKYTNRPLDFRALLDETKSVISGSFGVKYLDPHGHWKFSDMDLYTTQDNAEPVIGFFEDEGYERETMLISVL